MRVCIGYFGISGILASLKYIPASISSCIVFTNPIITTIVAKFVLNEEIRPWDILSILTSFCGIVLINNPF
jgi:drug/metabolite transporter (DMT)-like permease